MLKARNGQVLNCIEVTTRCALWKLYLDLAIKLSSHKFTFRLLLFTSMSDRRTAGPPDSLGRRRGLSPCDLVAASAPIHADAPVTDCDHNGYGSARPPWAAWRAPTRCRQVPP